jgi:hypothetical protein
MSGRTGLTAVFALLAGLLAACTPRDEAEAWGDVDPAFTAALERYEAWSGECDMTDPQTRAQIEAGVEIIRQDAMECALAAGLAGRDWQALSEAEQLELTPLIGRLYGLTGDRQYLDYELCHLDWSAKFRIENQTFDAVLEPAFGVMILRGEAPEAYTDRLIELFHCRELTLEERLARDD